jgi:hypothetical protein
MHSILNLEYISDYSKKYCALTLENAFRDKKTITGPDLLHVTDIPQINYFIVKNLFRAWQREIDKVRSPYFNYDDPEVQKMLKQLMNQLSNHISVDKENFQPLLLNAIQNCIILVLSPYDYFHKEVDNQSDPIQVDDLKKMEKYIKINAHFYKAFINKVYLESQSEITRDKAFEILDYIINSLEDTPEEPERYIDKFNQTLSMDTGKLYNEEHTENSPEPSDHSVTNEEKPEPTDTVSNNRKGSIHKIESIRKNISINQRYMFVNELFGEDSNAFNIALTQLDEMGTKKDAMNLIDRQLSKEYQWDRDSEIVMEFLDIVERKFL